MKNLTSSTAWSPLAVAVLVLAAGAPFVTAQSPATSSAAISGRVLAASTSKPVMAALVTVTAPELPGGQSVLSDDKGLYSITGLPAGHYTVVASKPGFLDLVYGQRRPLMEGEVIELDKGEEYPNTDCMLLRAGAIGGKIVDENGEPVGAAMLELFQVTIDGGQQRVAPLGTTQTDDRGAYRFWGLMPGTYFVKASAPALGSAPQVLDPAYFPGVRAFEQARPLTIGISQESLDINIELPRTPVLQ